MSHSGKHAIVIGASMGGLLAARALAEHFDAVTLVERDSLALGAAPRKGVPQGRHPHALLARGGAVLQQWFPGLPDDVLAQGGIAVDLQDQVMWFNHGVYLQSAATGLRGLSISRPKLEGIVRQRLAQRENVRLRDGSDVLEPVFDRAAGRVTGLRVQNREGGAAETLAADLVVDASGRGSQSPAWLEAMGYAKPREEIVQVDVGYMTMQFRRRPEHLPGKAAVLNAACRPDWRFGVILEQEGGTWIVTLGGYLGDKVPTDLPGYIAFAKSLQKPEIYGVIKDAEPLSEATPYRFTGSLRRHYAELSRFPDGYLVFGDALASFNPIYGQGMTVAAMESLALHACLNAGLGGLATRFFRAASKLIDNPWQIAVGSDLHNVAVEGKRSAQTRFINWYIGKFFNAAQRDPGLAQKFIEVANLMRQPASLLAPATALRVWQGQRAA